METLPLEDVIVPDNRQRREFNEKKMADLIGSILSKGLLHPIVVTQEKRLVAGERRYRAITEIHATNAALTCNGSAIEDGHIPITYLADLSPIDLREAELEENIIRDDLTWQEHTAAVAELHKLRQEQHGKYSAATKEGWRMSDTAVEVYGDKATSNDRKEVSEDISLAEFLDDPLVSTARTKKEAKRMMREELKRRQRQDALKDFDHTKSEHTLILGDYHEQTYPHKFTCVVADPPYGVDIHKHKGWDTTYHEYDDSEAAFQDVLQRLPDFLHSVTDDAAHAYIFCDPRRFPELFTAFLVAGWDPWDRPLIWNKGSTGSFSRHEYGPRRCYEAILYANKGQKKVTGLYSDVISIQNPTTSSHPAAKPPDLYEELLKRSCLPGEYVLDPFCGSGPIFAAAQKQNLIATGVEVNKKYFEIAQETLKGALK